MTRLKYCHDETEDSTEDVGKYSIHALKYSLVLIACTFGTTAFTAFVIK